MMLEDIAFGKEKNWATGLMPTLSIWQLWKNRL